MAKTHRDIIEPHQWVVVPRLFLEASLGMGEAVRTEPSPVIEVLWACPCGAFKVTRYEPKEK